MWRIGKAGKLFGKYCLRYITAVQKTENTEDQDKKDRTEIPNVV